MPRSILIFGKKCPIVKKKLVGLYGYFDKEEFKIYIDPTICDTDEKFMHTLIHEMIHGVLYRISVGQTGLSPDLEEIICDSVATQMLETFDISI